MVSEGGEAGGTHARDERKDDLLKCDMKRSSMVNNSYGNLKINK